MRRWMSRLLLVLWLGGDAIALVAALVAVHSNPPPGPSGLPALVLTLLLATAGCLLIFLPVWVMAMGMTEAAVRRHWWPWFAVQVLLPPIGSLIYIVFAPQRCSGCLGSGRRRIGCLKCGGEGRLSTGRELYPATQYGPMRYSSVIEQYRCDACQGRGYFDQGPCLYCGGSGRSAKWNARGHERLHPLAKSWKP